jgi:type IV pilus assembly protein PilV
MITANGRTSAAHWRGFTLLEILITIVILAFGLLGVAGLQARIQILEMEAYQRAQAIVLLQDMVDRINANRKSAMDYASLGVPSGTGNSTWGTANQAVDCIAAGYTSGYKLDLCEWNNALIGAAETSGAANVGAMIGARGCVTSIPPATMPREFEVAVVWQGLTPTVAPGSTTCGQGQYGDDKTRRAMVARVMIGCLQNDPTTGLCVTP